MKRVYLDYAAATPIDERVVATMQPYYSGKFYNPSALYQEARDVKAGIDAARNSVAQSIGAKPSEIIFTAGGTEADNLAIRGLIAKYPSKHIVISAIEHDAVFAPAQEGNVTPVGVDVNGVVNIQELEQAITDDTILVSIMLVNNEIGTVQPIQDISEHIQKMRMSRLERDIKTPLFLHTDACQAPLYLDVHVGRLGVDLMTLNGGKIHGPKQSGILYVRAGVELSPIILGGGQEFGLRSGTEQPSHAIGFAKALELAQKGRHERVKKVSEIRDYFIDELEARFGAELNGHRKARVANNVNVIFPDSDNERVLFALDDLGVAAAAGSACSASKDISSRALRAIGCSDEEARSSVRFSLGQETSREDIEFVLDKLKTALQA